MPYFGQPILIGEVLFDIFENGQAVLGGAPFNVAWHLQGFGEKPLFISRIGKDKYGEQITATMQDWGMSTTGLQIDTDHSTGMVQITLDKGQPTFDICDEVAYDFVDIRQIDSLLPDTAVSLLYHGSLAARHGAVYDTILQMRQAAATSFVDINLRPPWWDKQKIGKLMQNADWLKVNDDELVSITGVTHSLPDMIEQAKLLLRDYNINTIILTRGEQGALIIRASEVIESQPARVENLQDTVGAGDAFSSVCILGMLHGWETVTILQRATEFAARICQQQGATKPDYELYESCKRQWQLT